MNLDAIEAIKARRSIRGFRPDPVPQEVIREIMEVARFSPSGMNTQTWQMYVIAGEALEKIKRDNIEKLALKEGIRPDLGNYNYEGVYRQRQVNLAIEIFKLMDINREDREKRTAWSQRGFRFFDAPVAIILAAEKSIDKPLTCFNIGAITQTICLAALNYGLGTCIEGQGVSYPDVIRKHAGIPESEIIIASIALGYPDAEFPANRLRSAREPLDSIVHWRGFS